jgi:hypothetical protein
VADDELDDQVVGAARETEPDSEVEFPIGGEVQVKGGEDLVLLFVPGGETSDGAQRLFMIGLNLQEVEGLFLAKSKPWRLVAWPI